MKLDQHRQGRETVLDLHQYVDLKVRRWGIMMRLHAEQTHAPRGAGADLLKRMIGFGGLDIVLTPSVNAGVCETEG